MKSILLFAASLTASLLAVGLCHAPSTRAQEAHPHQHEHSEQLGRVNFPVSCTADARARFNRAVAWLHSFEYEEAEAAFAEVIRTDPRCAMGYWGIAMSNYHPIWAPPGAAELKKGREAVERAEAVVARTPRERAYVAAIRTFYKDSDRLDHRTRALAYGDAMGQLHRRYPSDGEAGVFYALTLIAKGMSAGDKSYADEKKAAQILNRVLAREPQHPGVTHYLIHSYDYPALAEMALPAARGYARIAPASAHAQHMPSHIFTRLGLWQEAISSNLGAEASAKAHAARNGMPGAWDEQLHAMDYLAYAYLQGAQDKLARGVLDELYKIRRVDPPSFKVAYAFAAIPARYALERRRWDEAAALASPPGNMEAFPWQRFRWAEAHTHYARAVGAARTGDTAAARREVESLAEIGRALAEVKGDYDWAKQVEIERQVASGWLAHAEGRREEALRLMRAAAELDDATEKHPVTPGAVLPAREQLGELLLELKEPLAALREFETSLRSAPNRFNGLYGAARAARLAADQKSAESYYGKLLALCQSADSVRPEVEEAKEFLARVKTKEASQAAPAAGRADTLRGAYGPYRANNDLLYYHLDVRVDPARRFLSGKNTVRFRMLKDDARIQLDLNPALNIDKILFGATPLKYEREAGAVFVNFPQTLKRGRVYSIDFHYSGNPAETGRFGGITFKKDPSGRDWVNTSCQDVGASVWWPNKDQWRDEVEGMRISVAVPNGLVDVSNGKFAGKTELGDGYTRWDWLVQYPINNYNVSLNIGNYTHFTDRLGDLPLDFYVLPENLDKARKQFAQSRGMLEAFRHYFGEYPFKKDGYKLIEAPYSGMEHQSAVTYGNRFANGYLERDWTGVGVSLRFDFIIIHESGHEWFGNSVTASDRSDMWIHEGWTTYLECLYVEYMYGHDDYLKYTNGYKSKVLNQRPIVAPRGVNATPPQDQYFKGALFLHTLRSVVDDEKLWRALLLDFYRRFKYRNIMTEDVVEFFNRRTGRNLTPVFNQYLRRAAIPALELRFDEAKGEVSYRWKADEDGFDMPVRVGTRGDWQLIRPTGEWQTMKTRLRKEDFSVATDLYYVDVNKS